MRIILVLVAMALTLPALADGQRIKSISNEINQAARSYSNYDNLSRREKQRLLSMLRDIKFEMQDLGMFSDVSNLRYSIDSVGQVSRKSGGREYILSFDTPSVISTVEVSVSGDPLKIHEAIIVDSSGNEHPVSELAGRSRMSSGEVRFYSMNQSLRVSSIIFRAEAWGDNSTLSAKIGSQEPTNISFEQKANEKVCMITASYHEKTYLGRGNSELKAEFDAKNKCGNDVSASYCDNPAVFECGPVLSGNTKVACLVTAGYHEKSYAATGSSLIGAKATALISCQDDVSASYCHGNQDLRCEEYSKYNDEDEYTCIFTADYHRKTFSGSGVSELIAEFRAKKNCEAEFSAGYCDVKPRCERK